MTETDKRQQADQAVSLIKALVLENETLQHRVQSLEQQIELLRRSGLGFGPDMARSWAKALEAADRNLWKALPIGTFDWNTEQGFPTGGGLAALILHLTAIPGDDREGQLGWNSQESQRERNHNKAIAAGTTKERYQRRPYPPRFRYNSSGCFWLSERGGHPELTTAIRQLTKGLKDTSKVSLLVQASFLLWKEEAVAKLNGDPLAALTELTAAALEAMAPAIAYAQSQMPNFGFFAGFFGESRKAQARVALGVSDDADADAIKRAYRNLARVHHPDAGGDAEQFNRVAAAYELLTA
jgi:hypothetical protein